MTVELNTRSASVKTAYEANANTNAFTDAEKTKLTGIETSADVTDTANVTAAGALMDSEVTNLAQVKAFSSADYATAAQGVLADASEVIAGTGEYNTHTVTVGASGADFTTLDEVMEWQSTRHFNNVKLVISLQAGTYTANFGTTNEGYHITGGNGLREVILQGANKSTTFIEVTSRGAFVYVKNCLFDARRITFNSLEVDWPTLAIVNSGEFLIYDCNINDFYRVVYTTNSHAHLDSGLAVSNNYGCVYAGMGSTVWIAGGSTIDGGTGEEEAVISTYGAEVYVAWSSGLTIQNFATALEIRTGGKIIIEDSANLTLTGNGADYSHPINVIQGDGSFITNGGMVYVQGYTVASLPAGVIGKTARVTDASGPSIGSTVSGGGSAAAMVWYNGTNWTVTGI